LVVVFGACAADGGAGVLVDELGVTLDREGSNEVELALRDLDERFF
jgi:hypothetical protein